MLCRWPEPPLVDRLVASRDGLSILVDLLLLVHAELAGALVDQQKETATECVSLALTVNRRVHLHDGEDLEEVVLGKVLLRMRVVQL